MADIYVFTEEGEDHCKNDVDDAGGGEEPAVFTGRVDRRCNSSFGSHWLYTSVASSSEERSHMARPEDLATQASSSGDHRYEGTALLLEGDSSARMRDDDEDATTEEDDDDEEDNMNPFARLLKWANTTDFYDKQMLARTLHETLRYVLESPEDVATVLDVMLNLSTNDDSVLRTELMEQVPQIAFLASDHPDKLGNVVTSNLVPMVVKYLTDPCDQVRKTSQAALLVLLEQELVSHTDVYEQVCPVILDLTEPDAMDDFKTEAVALMSKMAPLVGRDMTERLFVERFTRLCSDTLFQVRKVCAANFGDFSGVVGTSATESILLPLFICLCEDGVWGVRKACAEVFMVVSCSCSLQTRREHLSPVYVSLLSDQSRWVRVAAFQNLGPFISTFADQYSSTLQYNADGQLVLQPASLEHLLMSSSLSPTSLSSDKSITAEIYTSSSSSCLSQPTTSTTVTTSGASFIKRNDMEITEKDIEDAIKIIDKIDMSLDVDGTIKKNLFMKTAHVERVTQAINAQPNSTQVEQLGKDYSEPVLLCQEFQQDNPIFNELNYWRLPLPDIDFDISEEESGGTLEESSTSRTHVESSEQSVIKEETSATVIQAELEALAATLAESVFSNDIKFVEKQLHDRSNSQETKDDRSNSHETYCSKTAAFASEDSVTTSELETRYENNESEEKRLTYAEVCSSSLSRRTENSDTRSVEWTSEARTESNESERVAATDSAAKSDSFGSTEESSCTGDDDDEDTVVFHLTDSANSLHLPESQSELELRSSSQSNPDIFDIFDSLTSFSNLTALSSTSSYLGQGQSKIRSREAQRNAQSALKFKQDIVPNTLLEHYISMTDPLQAETVDNEITRHCAYSLPAVALTLGRRYWPVLKDTYEILASDMHWKVRRTLAFSIHELAHILGEDLAQKDLLPVFEGFIKDLDEVRIGVLKHLANFLKLLPETRRNLFLPRLNEFLNPDNANNWRFRLELAIQLGPISELCSPEECWKFICPITFALLADKVMQIRRTCFVVVSKLAHQLMTEDEDFYILPFSRKLDEKFAQAPTWTKRQSFVYVVGQMVRDSSLPLPVLCSLFLNRFLDLAQDRVPNIRLAIAKIMNSTIMTKEYFVDEDNEAAARTKEVLHRLQVDLDRDVKYFATYSSSMDHMFDVSTND